MGKGLLQKADRHGHRKGNSEYKYLLESIGFKDTNSRYLKQWMSGRIHHNTIVESDEFPIKICYDNKVGCFRTWAEACYRVAIEEKKKGNKI